MFHINHLLQVVAMNWGWNHNWTKLWHFWKTKRRRSTFFGQRKRLRGIWASRTEEIIEFSHSLSHRDRVGRTVSRSSAVIIIGFVYTCKLQSQDIWAIWGGPIKFWGIVLLIGTDIFGWPTKSSCCSCCCYPKRSISMRLAMVTVF